MEDKKIKVKITDVVAISKDPLVDLADPTITAEDGKIIATQNQEGGVVETQTKKTEVSAVDLDENLKPENIRKDVSIFGVVGTQSGETAPFEVDITKNGTVSYEPVDEVWYNKVTINTDVKPKTVKLPTQYIDSNGDFTIEKPEDPYTRYNDIDIYVDVQPNLQDKVVNVGSNGSETITADEEDPEGVKYDGLKSVEINVDVKPVREDKTVNIRSNGYTQLPAPADEYKGWGAITINTNVQPRLQSKAAYQNGTVFPSVGYDGLQSVNVDVKPTLEEKEINITENGEQTFDAPEDEYKGWGQITVKTDVKPTLQEKTTFKNGVVRPDEGYDGLREVNVIVEPKLQSKRATVTDRFAPLVIIPDEGYDGLSSVDVISDIPINLQDRTVNITENGQTIIRKQGFDYDGLGTVTVNVDVSGDDKLTELLTTHQSNFEFNGDITNQVSLFYDNSYIKTIKIPNVSQIPDYFCGLVSASRTTQLTDVQCRPRIIGAYAFAYRGTTNLHYENINFERCVEIRNGAFNQGTYSATKGFLSTVNLPECLSIGQQAFGYQALTKVILPKNKNIGSNGFYGCNRLKTADILGYYSSTISKPSDILNVVLFASAALDTLVIRAGFFVPLTSAAYLGNGGIKSKTGSIYVPDELVETYKAATNWSSFATIIKPLSEYVEA